MIATIEKDEAIKSRIGEIVADRGGNRTKLADEMQISPAYLASVINSPDKNVTSKLLKAFATIEINLNWLVTGGGEMYINIELLDSWKKRAVENEITILSLEKKLDRLAFLVEHLDALLLSSHDENTKHGNNNQKENANSIK
jgi:DNA-binding Xre family transcriptional regulator